MGMPCVPTLSPHHPYHLFDLIPILLYLISPPLTPHYLYYYFLFFLLHFLHYFLDADAGFPRLLDLDTGHAPPVLLLRYYPPPLYLHYLQYTWLLLLVPCLYYRSMPLRTPWHPCIRSDRLYLAVLGFAPLFSSSYSIPPLHHYLPDFHLINTRLAHPGIVASLHLEPTARGIWSNHFLGNCLSFRCFWTFPLHRTSLGRVWGVGYASKAVGWPPVGLD